MAATWLGFAILLLTALAMAAAAEWQPVPKGDAMKALLAGTIAALLAFAALSTYAAPLAASPSVSAPAAPVPPSSEDKDKEKQDKKDG